MDLTRDDVLMILKIMRESDVSYLDLQVGDLKVVLSKDASVDVAGAPTVGGRQDRAVAADAGTVGPPVGLTQGAVQEGVSAAPPVVVAHAPEDGLVEIAAPMVGVFYSRPDPGSPRFVQLGDRVKDGTTVGLVEVMKVFNAVTAGTTGMIEKIIVEDGQFVEFGQILFLVRPVE